MGDGHHLAGIKISPLDKGSFLAMVAAALEERSRLRVTFLNPDYARRALLDPELRQCINGFDVVLVDGNGVRAVAPLFGFTVPERLDTDSLAPDLMRLCADTATPVYLFGCAPGVADRAAAGLEASVPGLRVAGTDHGYHDVRRGHPGRYSEEDSAAIVDSINASGAGLLVVSLPTPLQQRWVRDNADRLEAPVIVTAGSYLDHAASGVDATWYPPWVERWQLNWLYRLAKEPRRLWRRYTVESLHFLLLVLRARLRRTG